MVVTATLTRISNLLPEKKVNLEKSLNNLGLKYQIQDNESSQVLIVELPNKTDPSFIFDLGTLVSSLL